MFSLRTIAFVSNSVAAMSATGISAIWFSLGAPANGVVYGAIAVVYAISTSVWDRKLAADERKENGK